VSHPRWPVGFNPELAGTAVEHVFNYYGRPWGSISLFFEDEKTFMYNKKAQIPGTNELRHTQFTVPSLATGH